MFSPSKKQEYTHKIVEQIERFAVNPHKKFFINEFVDNHRVGEPLGRLDQSELIWKEKRNLYKQKEQAIAAISPDNRLGNGETYNRRVRCKTALCKSSLNESNLNNSIQQEEYSVSPIKNYGHYPSQLSTRKDFDNKNLLSEKSHRQSVIGEYEKRSPLQSQRNSGFNLEFSDKGVGNGQQYSRQTKRQGDMRFQNTNILLGQNDSSQKMNIDKGIKIFKDSQIPGSTINHLQNKTSISGFNHNIRSLSYERSLENSMAAERIFNFSGIFPQDYTLVKNGIRIFDENKTVGHNPLTGQNFKAEKPKGIKILGGYSPSRKIFQGNKNVSSSLNLEQYDPLKQFQMMNPIVQELDNENNNEVKLGRKKFPPPSLSPMKQTLQIQVFQNCPLPLQINHKKLIDSFPKSNIPSINNGLACQGSQLYSNKYKENNYQVKDQKIGYGQRNTSPHIFEIFNQIYHPSEIKDIHLQDDQSKKDIDNQSKVSYSGNQQIEPLKDISNHVNDYSIPKSGKNEEIVNELIGEQKSSSSKKTSTKSRGSAPEKRDLYKDQVQQINIQNLKQASKMGEIQGVKKIYDFESYKNTYK